MSGSCKVFVFPWRPFLVHLPLVDTRPEKGTGFEGQQQVRIPEQVVASARNKPLLRDLLATAAGSFPRALGHLRRRPVASKEAILIYCVKGGGWCQMSGELYPVRPGDLLVLPPDVPHTYGAHASNPWTIHWVHAVGDHVREYLSELGVSGRGPLVRIGDEDLQVTLLFNEVLRSLKHGTSYFDLLRASATLGHLLALVIQRREHCSHNSSDGVQKVGQSIIYMSEHLDEPLRISNMAALASLSPAHFTVLFKQQTGSSPRDYLHLLRMHRACQLLHGTELPVKDIAARLGYQDQFHFSRQFKAFQGLSPSQYRGK